MTRATIGITAAIVAVAALFAWVGSATSAPPAGGANPTMTPSKPLTPGTVPVAPRPRVSPRRFGYGFGYRSYGYGYSYSRTYVVAQKRGPDITWTTHAWAHDVYAKVVTLRYEAEATAQANTTIGADVAKLAKQATELKAAIAAQDDPDKKQELQAKMKAVEQAMLAREAAIRPVVRWVVAGPFDARRLDEYLLRLEREAYDARWKAGEAPTGKAY